MKYILVIYLCSMASGECPQSSTAPYQYDNHTNCVENGYKVAFNTFKNIEEIEGILQNEVEEQKIAIKFECREVNFPKPIIPPKKPKV